MRPTTDKITAIPEACSGCLICQLACSFAFTKSYNPSKSRILIEEVDATEPFRISFTEECNDCGLCVRYCFYGALEMEGRKRIA
jgi:Fe-S-cluster-containing hydrogenase component 2